MPYGLLTSEMLQALPRYIQGSAVWDLGAGDLKHARTLLKLGASHVHAVEKEPLRESRCPVGVTYFHGYVKDVLVPATGIDVTFLSWPVNWDMVGLIPVLRASRVVVYLGKNTEGSSCGIPALFKVLREREILKHFPHPRNVMIVYGGVGNPARPLVEEEWAGLHTNDIITFGSYVP